MENIIERLDKYLKENIKILVKQEARFLVDTYYQMQKTRIQLAGQSRAIQKSTEQQEKDIFFPWLEKQQFILENRIKSALDLWTDSLPIGRRLKTVVGVGPVICAGLLAHIDIEKAKTAENIWAFAGLNPDKKWVKGEKRPWNAALKVLCWKLGESFVKVQSRENAFYAKNYQENRKYYEERNDNFVYKEEALRLSEKFGKNTECYKAYITGKLPKAQIYARAKRKTVKLFLSHLQEAWWIEAYNQSPIAPYIFSKSEHKHKIPVPF